MPGAAEVDLKSGNLATAKNARCGSRIMWVWFLRHAILIICIF
jgi:hypothetical protein